MKTIIKLVLRITVYGSAIAAGFGTISIAWLIGTAVSSYLLSIYEESESTPSGDFRDMETNEFLAADNNIKKRLGVRLVYAGIVFAVCLGISHFEFFTLAS